MAKRGHVEVLEKLWDWAKNLQIKPEELRNRLWLSKDNYGETAWQSTARLGPVEVLENLCDWSKELQLKPEELMNHLRLLNAQY
jgi:hypothetical protein